MRKSSEEFEPKIGRIKSRGDVVRRPHLNTVVRAMSRAGAHRIGSGKSKAIARPRGFGRRVIVKARIVSLKGKSLGGVRAHLSYLVRDGVTRDGAEGQLYGRDERSIDRGDFLDRFAGDNRQFRFIVAPEDGSQLDDLKPLVRDLMQGLEHEMGMKFEWIAVDHFNTGHPHSHIIVRGRDDRGKEIIIPRHTISHGLRQRAQDWMTRELGPKSEHEKLSDLQREVSADRFTELDRRLVALTRENIVHPGTAHVGTRDLLIQRARHLETMGLAHPASAGLWRLEPQMQQTLTRMGERVDIIRSAQRALTAAKVERDAAQIATDRDSMQPVIGRIVARGLSDELADRHHLIIDGIDGKVHVREIGRANDRDDLKRGGIVEILPATNSSQQRVRMLSMAELEAQIKTPGLSWLDQLDPKAIAPEGFGVEVMHARYARWRQLQAVEIVPKDESLRVLSGAELAHLQERMLAQIADHVKDPSLEMARLGKQIEGTYLGHVDTADGRKGIFDRGMALTMAPWSPALERRLHEKIIGIVHEHGIALGRAIERDLGLGL
jgi:type IV secretory pathway VirD2 relaxase